MGANVMYDEETAPARPRLAAPAPADGRKPAEIALDLRRFHASPAEEGVPAPGPYRSAALAAVEGTPGPPGGELDADDERELASGGIVPFLRVAARRRLMPRRDGFRVEVAGLARRLRDRLESERARDGSREPGRLREAMSPGAGGHIDFRALSAMIGTPRGAVRLGTRELERARAALEVLEGPDFAADEPLVRVVHDGSAEPSPAAGVAFETAGDPAAAAIEIFAREAARLTETFRASRVARLVLDNALDEGRQGPWLDRFGPSSFRKGELLLAPMVVAIERVEDIEERGLVSFSRLLLSGLPVHLIVRGSPLRGAFRGRLEPAYLALGHRKAFAQQSSAGNAGHLVAGLLVSLDHARPALHVLDEADGPADALAAARALASRAHPCFRYDPAAGSSWAGRLDFSGNPAPESEWPVRSLEVEDADGTPRTLELPVTFADYLLDDPAAGEHVRPVPAGCPEDALAPLAEWLGIADDEAAARVPWLWAMGPEGDVVRVAVTRRIAIACRERGDYWHTLQELAGLRNEYVTEAVRRVRSEGEEAVRAERDRLIAAHAEQLATVRKQAVDEAMGRLARRLLDLESAPVAASAPAAAPAPPAGAVPPTSIEDSPPPRPAEPPAAAPVEDGDLGEPWIDTPLCTSCNDCTNINARLFVYDANKQAVMGHLETGTFAQVVQAAEKCPARCIHPGSPWNREEAGLDALIERAKPFQ